MFLNELFCIKSNIKPEILVETELFRPVRNDLLKEAEWKNFQSDFEREFNLIKEVNIISSVL